MSFSHVLYWCSDAELIYKSFNWIEKKNNLVDAPTRMRSEPKYKISFVLCCIFFYNYTYFPWDQPLKVSGLLIYCHSAYPADFKLESGSCCSRGIVDVWYIACGSGLAICLSSMFHNLHCLFFPVFKNYWR